MRFFTLICLAILGMYAHAAKVEGVVLDELDQPVIGATVRLKSNSSNGTITDFDGKFVIKVKNPKKAVLVVSYVGYKTKYVPLNGRTIVEIKLEPSVTALNEVVVVGYGAVRKSDLTGSVSSIQTSEAEAARNNSFQKMLQGKAAGVQVSVGSNAPGGSVSVKIRGTSSLRGDSSPLYVIDGNIISGMGDTMNPMGQGSGAGNSSVDAQNPLASLNALDIESIEILKDASATAIYGSQGANGVILITTKRGKSGKPTVSFSANATVSSLKKEIPMLGTAEYLDFYNAFVDPESGNELTMEGYEPVNWQKYATRDALSQNYRVSVSGKSNKTNYYMAAGYVNQEGIVKNTGVSKYDLRLNLENEINKAVDLKLNMFYSNVKTSMTSGTDRLANTRSSIVRHMISYKPLKGLDNNPDEFDEELTGVDAWFTDYDDDSEEQLINTSLAMDVQIIKPLKIRAKGGFVQKQKDRQMWFGNALYNGSQCNGKAGLSTLKATSYNGELLMMYNQSFNQKHHVSGTVGVVYDSKEFTRSTVTGENFFAQDLRANGISQAMTNYPMKYDKSKEELFSALARAIYNYDERYILTATFRADGSSKFSSKNRFSYFPSFAFAWRANQESFLKEVDEISNLKLRLGWGRVGNQAISPYQTMASYNTVFYSQADGSAQTGIVPAIIPNPDLKWEVSEQFNVGVDLGLYEQRIVFSADAYVKTTKDLLQQIAIPYSSGYSTTWINKGEIENRGLEFSLDMTPVREKDWEWNIGGNFSIFENEIKHLGIAPADFGMLKDKSGYFGATVGNNTYTKFPANVFLEGYSIGTFLGYKTNGIMQEEQYNSAENQANPLKINGTEILPGDVLFVDQNGDGVVNDADRVVVGNPNPDFTYAINTSLSYKQWTLDMAFSGVYGNDIINANLIDEWDVANASKNVRKDAYRQAWTPENPNTTYPRLGYRNQGILTDRIIEDGSYLKLANVTLSYALKLPRTAWLKSCTLTATGTNLLTWTSYSGYDPDVNTFSNDTDRMGIDLVSYPASRSFTFGVNATF